METKVKTNTWFWIRLGANADLEKYHSPEEAIDMMLDYMPAKKWDNNDINFGETSLVIPGSFDEGNHISAFWGDDDAQVTRHLTIAEWWNWLAGLSAIAQEDE